MNTQDIVENWRREAIQEGLEQGERKVLLRQLPNQLRIRGLESAS